MANVRLTSVRVVTRCGHALRTLGSLIPVIPADGWVRSDQWLQVVQRLICEDAAQDIIEYALLAAFIGVVGILAWDQVSQTIGVKYIGWDTGIQSLSSCTPDPGGGGC